MSVPPQLLSQVSPPFRLDVQASHRIHPTAARKEMRLDGAASTPTQYPMKAAPLPMRPSPTQ
eukprot:2744301-Prorocentrum_lima.AAC.1